jgi:hypothetical protein
MLCYHVNLGYPLLDEGAEYMAPISEVVWAAHAGTGYTRQGVGYRHAPAPKDRFHEQVWQHELAPDADGRVSVALINDRIALAFELSAVKAEFPCMFEWQNFQAGQYALGLEPATHHVQGPVFARARGEERLLEHGETLNYHTDFRIHAGADALAAVRARIAALAAQPDDPYPAPTGNFVPLRRGGHSGSTP